MKTGLWFAVGVTVTVTVVAAVLLGGWLLWTGRVWAAPLFQGMGTWAAPRGVPCEDQVSGWGPGGMMGRRPSTSGSALCSFEDDDDAAAPERATPSDIEEAESAFERYVAALGYDGLAIVEVMEFEHNYYAIVEESDSQIGAMELLLDKTTGTVGPEIGPNMMWNVKYGMHQRGMMGRWQGEDNALSETQVLEIAQRWLDAHDAGATVESHADPFYGYYTVHTERDGEIEGMLSVHGSTGQVWYHTWHGDFVQMIEHQEGNSEH